MTVALHLFLYCTVCTVCGENLFLSLDPFSGESEAQSQKAIGSARLAHCPANHGKRAGRYVFNVGKSDRHTIPAATV